MCEFVEKYPVFSFVSHRFWSKNLVDKVLIMYLQIYVKNVSVPMVMARIHKIVWTPVYYSADAVSFRIYFWSIRYFYTDKRQILEFSLFTFMPALITFS